MMKFLLSSFLPLVVLLAAVDAFLPSKTGGKGGVNGRALLRPSPSSSLSSFITTTTKTVLTSTTISDETKIIDNTSDDDDIKDDITSSQNDNKNDNFNWFKAWYPIVPVEILDEEIPHRFQLLNMDIVIWKDGTLEGEDGNKEFGPKPKKSKKKKLNRIGGQWRAFVDECPHRKVPLSEGRVEKDGTLLCSYHGWRFEGDGKLVDIPQIDSTTSDTKLMNIRSNPKSQCNSFPVQIVDGLLWIWPESGSDAKIESALTEIPNYKLPNSVDESRIWYGPWNYRQLPYGSDYFIENVVDPAHVPVSHHNVVGSRYGDLRQNMKLKTKMTKNGFSIETSSPGNQGPPATTTFSAPSSVAIETSFENGTAIQTLELYSSPSQPGFCNHVGRMVIVKPENGKMPALLRTFTLPLPKWVNHIMASSFLNQDALFLHHQERYLAKTGEYTSLNNNHNNHNVNNNNGESLASNYPKVTLPIETDRGVLSFRDWLDKRAGGRIPYKYNPTMPEPNNEVVFDVWNGHTKYCSICQSALKKLKIARFVAFFIASCLTVLRPSATTATTTLRKVLSLSGVLVSAGIGLLLNKLIGTFYRFEFSHGKND